MKRIHDISLPLSRALAGWPGDTPFEFALASEMRLGATVNVGGLRTSVHAGTHIDAPFHFFKSGATVEQLALEAFIGPTRVIDARGHDSIGIELFDGVDFAKTPRLLLCTGAWRDRTIFPEKIPTLAENVPAFFAANHVRLIGLDLPSFDAIDSTTLPIHHALADAGIQLLESLNLDDVAPDDYELIALPLRIIGADASPVRAILREMN